MLTGGTIPETQRMRCLSSRVCERHLPNFECSSVLLACRRHTVNIMCVHKVEVWCDICRTYNRYIIDIKMIYKRPINTATRLTDYSNNGTHLFFLPGIFPIFRGIHSMVSMCCNIISLSERFQIFHSRVNSRVGEAKRSEAKAISSARVDVQLSCLLLCSPSWLPSSSVSKLVHTTRTVQPV